MAPLAQEDGPPAWMSRELAPRDPPLEADAEAPGQMGVDADDRSRGIHHAPQQRCVHAVQNADLNQTPPPRGVLGQTSALGRSRLGVGRSPAEAISEPARGAAVQHGRYGFLATISV